MKPHKFVDVKSDFIFCEYCGIGCGLFASEKARKEFREKVDEGCNLSPIVLREASPLQRVHDGYSVLTFLSSRSVLEKKIAMDIWLNIPNSCLVDNLQNKIIEWHDPKL